MTLNIYEFEAFSIPRALIHTRIIWALSPMVPQVLGVTAGSFCAHGVVGTPLGEVLNNDSWILYSNVLIVHTIICQ
jgi:hypothetical protein